MIGRSLTCKHCGRPFKPLRGERVYCSPDCVREARLAYMRAYNKELRETATGREMHRDDMRQRRANPAYRNAERERARQHRRENRREHH